jgi:hypothetical protein
MADNDNDIVIVGPPMAVALYLPPDPLPDEHRRLLFNVDVIGQHNEFMLITCRQPKIAALRAAGGEVIVVDADANVYANRVQDSSEEELIAFLDERVQESREDLRIADAGRERDKVVT